MAVYGASTGLFCLALASNSRTWGFPTEFSDTYPLPSQPCYEICCAVRTTYPAGEGSAAIFPNILPKSRRVR